MKDLVCTKCDKTLVTKASDEASSIMEAGYCNDQSCLGKLQWRDSE